ncbi:MAG: DUF4430 domain-containing protein [Candidatus Parcubacteria bacterium]|nr:DUF4430 domain-containing protein [Candidatus Parcubacteria bacterium]
MSKKISIIIIVVIFIAFAIFSYQRGKKEEKLTLILDYGNNHKQSFQLLTSEQKRAWSILQEVAAVSKIDLEATNDFYPQKIDGVKDGTDNKHWVFYVNGIKQNSSPFDAVVKPPAEVVFRFE